MRGSIKWRSGKPYLVIYQGVDPATGREKRKWIPCTDRKQAEAMKALIARNPAFGSGVGPNGSSRLRLGAYLRDWLDGAVKLTCSERERQSRAAVVRLHIVPRLGHVPLARIASATIEQFLATMERADPARVFKVLRTALNHAKRQGLINSNPCDQVAKPRPRVYEPRLWTDDQARTFREGARGSRFYPLYLLLMTGGLRPGGEPLAIRWDDTDLAEGLISLRRDLERPRGGGFKFDQLKTKRARRLVVLPAAAVEELQSLRREQRKERLRRGLCEDGKTCRVAHCPRWHDRDLVFCQHNGKPLHWHNVVMRDFRPLCAKLELPAIRPYDLRHWHGTALADEGTHPSVSAQRMGHSVAVNSEVYTHPNMEMQRRAADAVGRKLRL